MDDSMMGTLCSRVRWPQRGALLPKSEVVQTLHTTVFTVLMEEAGELVRANEDATKLTDIARERRKSGTPREGAICTLAGGEEKLSGSTVEKAYPENSEAAACDPLC